MEFITQPFGAVRLGDFLLSHLADPQWTVFRAAIAFVKRSGTQFIRQPLQEFSGRAAVRISVGIDLFGTSREGLSELLECTPGGQVFVYRNSGPYTFHPKVYVFKSAHRADLIVGSGNLTAGGLFTNYEASIAVSIDLAVQEESSFLEVVEETLDAWSEPQEGICYGLTSELLAQLVASGLVRSEAQMAAAQQALTAQLAPVPTTIPEAETMAGSSVATTTLFASFSVPPPPPVPNLAPAVATAVPVPDEQEGSVTVAEVGTETPLFVISILTRDLPMQGSSPEISITKYIRDVQPTFWGWPSQFEGPDDRGQYRRSSVRIRYGQNLCNAYLQQYPDQKPDGTKASADFRMGAIAPIVADLQQEDDLVLLSVSNEPNVDYAAQVVRVGSPEHEALLNGMQVYSRSRSASGTYRKFRYIL
jgi:hypothetical protein